jgi:hypothetical protein
MSTQWSAAGHGVLFKGASLMHAERRGNLPARSQQPVGTRDPLPNGLADLTELEVPPLSSEDRIAYAEFSKRLEVLRALTLGCLHGHHTGAYISGPPGVSKSYTVLNKLREHGASWQLHQRITAKPLFFELQKHAGAVHVIDDCEQLLSEKSALTLLRAILGGERINHRRERPISYSISGSRARVVKHYFYGSVIFISNRPLTDERPEVRAIMSRIPSLSFDPPEEELRAVMRHVARQGYEAEASKMSPNECVEVIEYVIQLAAELRCHLDLRWIEHGYGHYLTHLQSGGRVDWRDMVKFHIINTLTCFDHNVSAGQGDAEHGEANQPREPVQEIAIAQEIDAKPSLNREQKVRLWQDRTGLSRATYYRRLEAGRADD